jgi:hypothetical protein
LKTRTGRTSIICQPIRLATVVRTTAIGDTVELAGRDARPSDEMWGRYASEETQRK